MLNKQEFVWLMVLEAGKPKAMGSHLGLFLLPHMVTGARSCLHPRGKVVECTLPSETQSCDSEPPLKAMELISVCQGSPSGRLYMCARLYVCACRVCALPHVCISRHSAD